ncbi:DsrE family protein [Candidatus Nitrospira bockiana]
MEKVAIVVFADTESHGDLGRLVNALEAVKEFKEAGDDVQLIFDGAGTKWIGELAKPDHKVKGLFDAVKDRATGACRFCAGAFGATESVTSGGVPLMGEYDGHPSFKKLVSQGYHVITF